MKREPHGYLEQIISFKQDIMKLIKIVSSAGLALALFLFAAPSEAQVALHGLYTPVPLQNDTTVIYLRDYLGTKTARSVSLPEGLTNHSAKKDTLVLTGRLKRKMDLLQLELEDQTEALLLINPSAQEVSISIPEKAVGTGGIRIFGSFNNWNRESELIEAKNGLYEASYLLEPGRYEYKIFKDGEELMDPANPTKVSNGMGGFNNLLQVDFKQQREPADFKIDSLGSSQKLMLIPQGGPVHFWVFWNNQPLEIMCEESVLGRCFMDIPAAAAKVKRSYLRVFSYLGSRKAKDMLIPLHYGKPVTSTDQLERLDWHQARLYFLMVDRFFNAKPRNDLPTPDTAIKPQANYLGGDLAGVTKQVEQGYFDSLGINTIWLSPITQNPLDAWGLWDEGRVQSKFSGYHGYWPISNIRVDFRFGDEAELRELLNTAHAWGNNMILDYVANHVHIDHPVYQKNKDWATNLYLPDGTKNTEKWDEQRLTTWFDDHLPTLDLRKWEVVDPMADSALYWVTNYSFDGFRHDATKHIDELYWRSLTYRIRKNTDKPIYQIGETYGSPQLINSYISTGMLDGQFDFNLYDAAVDAFAREGSNLETLKQKLEQSLSVYGYHHLMGNISGNQDRSRFISLASGDVLFSEDQKKAGWDREIGKPKAEAYQRLALLHAFNNAIPGLPVIYYGDEIGLPGAGDPDNRRMMKFENLDEDEQKLFRQSKKLNNLRGSQLPLIYGSTEIELPNEHVMLIRRQYFDDEVLILINTSTSIQHVELKVQKEPNLEMISLTHSPGVALEQQPGITLVELPPLSYEYFTFIPEHQ